MFPGDSPQTVTAVVKDDSPDANACVSSVKAYLTVVKATGVPANAACAADDYLLGGTAAPGTPQTARALTWTPVDLARGATASTTFPLQCNNKAPTNQDGCKLAAVTINCIAG